MITYSMPYIERRRSVTDRLFKEVEGGQAQQ